MATIPYDLIEEILHRLPVKPLKRFRCVAKAWCFLIDSEKFIKSHLKRSLETNSHRRLILGGDGVFTVDVDDPVEADLIKPPFYYQKIDAISNSCNGLVLVSCEPPVLWNPFTADYRKLPGGAFLEDPAPAESYWKTIYGLDYDRRNDDYKVVRIFEYRHERSHVWLSTRGEIYSLKSNSWRAIEDFKYPLPFVRGRWRIQVSGGLHMEMGPGNSRVVAFNGGLHIMIELWPGNARILAFDVETEKHVLFDLPPAMRKVDTKGRLVHVALDTVGGCLCVICSSAFRSDIWVMKEYGVTESWTKVFTLRPPVIDESYTVKMLMYSDDGSKILLNLNDMKLVWYDLKEKTAEELLVGKGMPYVFYAEACVESLVSVNNETVEVKKPVVVEKTKRKKMIKKKGDDFLSEGFKLVL